MVKALLWFVCLLLHQTQKLVSLYRTNAVTTVTVNRRGTVRQEYPQTVNPTWENSCWVMRAGKRSSYLPSSAVVMLIDVSNNCKCSSAQKERFLYCITPFLVEYDCACQLNENCSIYLTLNTAVYKDNSRQHTRNHEQVLYSLWYFF